MRKRFRVCAVSASIFCGLVCGQVIVSSIVGHVTDPSAASVPGAQVTATNTQTGVSVKTVTGSEGTYSIPGLLAGTYDVTVEKEGLQVYQAKGITLLSSQTARVDAALAVTGVRQTVAVMEQAPMIQTDSMSIGGSVTTQQLAELPTSLQTVDAFIALAPGVQAFGSATNPPIGGGRNWGSVNFTLNGVEVNDPGNSGGVMIQNVKTGTNALLVLPPPSAIQELNVQSGGMTAQYRGKSTVTIVTKAGANQFHGGLYEFLQNTDLNANDFTLNSAGKPRPAEHLNQYGGNLGGPIKRDKAFFFFDYSGYRRAYSVANQLRLPGAAMRNGDFSSLCSSAGGTFVSGVCSNANNQLYNPFTGSPFPNNQIPDSMITSQAKRLLTYLPLPTAANSPGLPNGPFNYVSTVGQQSRIGAWDLRIDYNISSQDRLFGVFARRVADPLGVAAANYPSTYGSRVNTYKETSATLSETHTFSPTTLNEFRASWGDYETKFSGVNLDFDVRSLWPQMPDSLFKGLPTITASGYTGLWSDYGTGLGTPRLDVEFADDFTHIRGRHTIQMGADETGYKMWNRVPSAANVTGFFGFNGSWTANSGWPNLTHSNGNSFADFLLGTASSSQTSATGAYASWLYTRYWGFYAQDTWQATPRLTVIYGLRYEYQSPWRYRTQQITSFDFRTNKLVLPQNGPTPTLPAGALPELLAAYPYETTQSIGAPLFYYRADKNNFAPRVGLAYRPFNDHSTVIRAGYGVYYNFQPGLVGSGREAFNPPWALGISQAYTSKIPGRPVAPFLPDITFTNPFPSLNASANVTPNPTLNYFQWDFKNAVAQEWNFTIERQFGNWAGRVSYLGDQTHHIPYNSADINRPLVQQPNVPIQEQRPYQPWGSIGSYLSAGKQNFNQLQLGVQKRFSSGVSFQAEYQFTRSLDNIDNAGGADNPANWNLSYGNTPAVHRHWLVFNYVWELPLARKSSHKVSKAVLGGWQVSGISTYGTGTPFSVNFSQTGTGIVGWSGSRADQLSGVPFYAKQSGHDITRGVQWVNPSAFAPPAKWTYGNSARNMLFGPGLWNWDITATKSFSIREHWRLQFRGDFFDAFNHFNLSNPDNTIPDRRDGGTPNPNSGMITSGSGGRIVQLGLKLSF
jgi:Carboxypeptidase regulatory-like domain